MRVVVTGGLGALGSQVVGALTAADHEAVIASRRTGVDLASGAGLPEALAGADAVVHTADTTNPLKFSAVTVGGTQSLVTALAQLETPPHLVTISIVNAERVPYRYYRAKRRADEIVLATRGPATVVRATQFHSLAALFARMGRLGPLTIGIRGMRIQPVDIRWVGQRLAEIAVGPPPATAITGPDLAGPDVFDVTDLMSLVAEHEGRRGPRPLGLPPVGALLRAFATELPAGPQAQLGGDSFEAWLSRQPRPLRGR